MFGSSTSPNLMRFGRYRVVRELGRGAMGVVYQAEDESLQRQVAIKTLLLPDDPKEREQHEARFRQEAKAAASLSHPNVITIYDQGREGDWLYIAMELLRGTELRELMRRDRLALPLAIDLAAQVAAGLAAAHARGIVHRDIKPSNIMVLQGQRAKLMDFGVARMQASEVKTQTGLMLGSPKYMSPEQVEGRVVDHRSDIFSLGSVLYEMVTGQAPFQGDDMGTLLHAILRAQPVPAGQRNPAVPPELDALLAKAMAKDPRVRYQDAGALAAGLRQCLGDAADSTFSGTWSFTDTSPSAAAASTAAEAAMRSAAAPAANASPVGSDDPTRPGAAGPGPWRLSGHWDATAALRRLRAPGADLPVAHRRSLPWGWIAAYAAAIVAALWIALR